MVNDGLKKKKKNEKKLKLNQNKIKNKTHYLKLREGISKQKLKRKKN